MARKKAISKAVQSLVRSNDAQAIRDALAQARAELARLQKENEGLKQKIKSLKYLYQLVHQLLPDGKLQYPQVV